jgi:hypothetical protein
MDLTLMQKKKHLLLLNRIMRSELKKDIIPIPSKLTEEEVNQYFNKLFVKKDDYYVPIKTKTEIMIDEEQFKDLIKRKKTKEEKKTEKELEKEKDKEISKKITLSVYKKFEKEFVEPYVNKKKAKEDFNKEEILMINKYLKLGPSVKKLVEQQLPNMWSRLLNPAYLEEIKRKDKLIEEEMKLKDSIKKEAKKKTEPKNELKESPIKILIHNQKK